MAKVEKENEPIETSPPDKLHITNTQPVENEVVTLSMTPLSIKSPQPRTQTEVRKSKYVIPDPAIQ